LLRVIQQLFSKQTNETSITQGAFWVHKSDLSYVKLWVYDYMSSLEHNSFNKSY